MWCPPVNEGLAVRWDPVVDVPGARGGLAVRQRLLRRVELQARLGYTVGRVRTQSFWSGLEAEADDAGVGRSYWGRTRQASGGVSLHF